jgi:lysozyme
MKITRQGIALIEMFEGVELKPYKDPAGHLTVGFGHKIEKGEPIPEEISMEQAYSLLEQDLKDTIEAVTEMVAVPITDNQFTALVAFAYNLGPGALKRSTLLRKLNEEDYRGAAAQFSKWTKAGPKGRKYELKGLVRRRAAEELVFRSPDPVWTPTHKLWAGKVGDPEGAEFIGENPHAIVIAVAPTVEDMPHGPSAEDIQPDGEGEG